jgi:hypothetical protein
MHKEIKGCERRGCKTLGQAIEALLRMGCVAPPNASHMVRRLGDCITYKVTTNKGIFQCSFFLGREKIIPLGDQKKNQVQIMIFVKKMHQSNQISRFFDFLIFFFFDFFLFREISIFRQ